MENFIKFAPCAPFRRTLPRELVEKLGCPVREVGSAALSFPAPGRSSAVTASCSQGPGGEQRAAGPGSEGSGHEGRPHTVIPLKSIETEDAVLVWAQPSLPGETLDKALSFPGPPFLRLFNGGNDHCPADIIKQGNRSERGPGLRLMILVISFCLLFSLFRGLQGHCPSSWGPATGEAQPPHTLPF